MANISRQALTKVIKQNLRSNLQGKMGSIMKEVGVNPAHAASLKGYEAKKVMMKLKEKGLLKPGATHLTAGEFESQFKKADAPTGPSEAVLKGRRMINMRERMEAEKVKKETITQALSREAREKDAAGKAPAKPAARTQTPALSGGVIGKAAQDASRSGGALGSFSGADRVERGSTTPDTRPPTPDKSVPEAIDPFGDE